MKQTISSNEAPKAIGPYSPAVRAGQLLFVSGQVPLDPATGNMVEGGIAEQTRRVLDNVGALLTAGGRSFADVVRTTIFLADMNAFAAVSAKIADINTNIKNMEARTDDGATARIDMTVEINDLKHLEKVIKSLRGVDGVLGVERAGRAS